VSLKRTQHRNLYIDPASGIYIVRKMVRGVPREISTGHTTEAMALRKMHQILLALANQKEGWAPKKSLTLAAWWKNYQEAKDKAPLTWASNEDGMNHWLPELGKLDLPDITHNLIERIAKRRKKQASPGTVARDLKVLKSVLQAALESNHIEKHPMKGIRMPKAGIRERVLSLDDQTKMQAVMSPRDERWMLFILGTGLRLTEVKTFRLRDLNWGTRILTVLGKGKKLREVPLLSPELDDIIREQADEVGEGPLFPMAKVTLHDMLTRKCKLAGVDRFGPHTLRHTFATRYLQEGGDIYVLSKLLGHSSVSVTERVYAHLVTQDVATLSRHIRQHLGRKREGKVLEFGKGL